MLQLMEEIKKGDIVARKSQKQNIIFYLYIFFYMYLRFSD